MSYSHCERFVAGLDIYVATAAGAAQASRAGAQ